MLKGISPLISPELLAALSTMGHGDEIVFADAHFPCATFGRRVIRADGLAVADLLDAVLPLFQLDSHVPAPVHLMAPVAGDRADPAVAAAFRAAVDRHQPGAPPFGYLEREAFYQRAAAAFAVVATGDTATYANVILTKGVTPVG
jgi:L-fucose mutarotase